MEGKIDISLKADKLFSFFGFNITNTLFTSVIFSVILFLIVYFAVRKFNLRPTKFQLVLEFLIMGGYKFSLEALGDEKITKKIYPILATFFIMILSFNLMKFIPGIESIKFGGHHLFKSVHSDLNMTLALSVVAWIMVQFLGVFILGIWKYGGKFIQIVLIKGWIPMINPIGLLELISEVAKMISLALRLFINILVGGVLIILLQNVSHYFVPTIGMLFEVFVAFLQAGVFALLTLFYIKLAISESH